MNELVPIEHCYKNETMSCLIPLRNFKITKSFNWFYLDFHKLSFFSNATQPPLSEKETEFHSNLSSSEFEQKLVMWIADIVILDLSIFTSLRGLNRLDSQQANTTFFYSQKIVLVMRLWPETPSGVV